MKKEPHQIQESPDKKEHFPHTKKICCAFCKGTGKDPFGQLYPGSTCQVCSGRKELRIVAPYATCQYCHGTGVEFSMQNTCTCCGGRGVISLGKKRIKKENLCLSCRGTGMAVETNLPCLECRGTGVTGG